MDAEITIIEKVFDKSKFLSDLSIIGIILTFFGSAILCGWLIWKLVEWWEGIMFVGLGIALLLMLGLVFNQRYFIERELKQHHTPTKEEDKSKVCPHCKMDIGIRNPSGYCDHLNHPDNCKICQKIIGTGKIE